jgi:hypothetical protein
MKWQFDDVTSRLLWTYFAETCQHSSVRETALQQLGSVRNCRIARVVEFRPRPIVTNHRQVCRIFGSKIYVCKYLKIRYVCKYLNIRYVCKYLKIRYVCEYLKIRYVCKYLKIRYVCKYLKIRYVCKYLKISLLLTFFQPALPARGSQ